MATRTDKGRKERSLLGDIGSKILEVLATLRLFIGEVQAHFDDQVDLFLRRVELLFILYLWISVGALFMVLGIFDLLIEYAKIPQPWVFTVGGLLILLTAVVFLQTSRLRRLRKR